MATATLNDLANVLFTSEDRLNRDNFVSYMSSPRVDLEEKVSFTLIHLVREKAGHERDPYDRQFVYQFTRQELENIFGQDLYSKLILVKELFEDRRLRDIPHERQYLVYFVHLLPAVLKKAQSKEDILRWDTAVKDMIVEYAGLEHPGYYIKYVLPQLVSNSISFGMLEKAKQLVSRAKGEVPFESGLYAFTDILGRVLGKVAEPQRLEEWYQPIINVIKEYGEDINRRAILDPLIEFVEKHNNPGSLKNFSPSGS